MTAKRSTFATAFLLPCALLAGCNVETHKNGDNKDDVNIGTPFGSMHVKTDNASVIAGLGLTPYPGAKIVQKKGDHDDGAADVSMSFGAFKLGVHAVELQSGDPQDKVVAFYRKDMARYGAVIACHGEQTLGQPARTADGLTCDTDRHGSADDAAFELRAGSPSHQHIAGVHAEDGATRIALVALDLPVSFKDHAGHRDHDRGDDERE